MGNIEVKRARFIESMSSAFLLQFLSVSLSLQLDADAARVKDSWLSAKARKLLEARGK